MKKDKTLLIMAAGLGSRFGGLKQIEEMGPNKEFLIDYSVYDAIKSGFTKVVFIIKEDFAEVFKNTIGKRVEPHIKTEYVYQDNKYIPSKYLDVVKKRTKPLGTAYAIYCAKEKIKEPFAIINADDFYGYDAFLKASKYLDNIKENYGIIAYSIGNTLTPNGPAKRGVCEVNSNNELISLTESNVVLKDDYVEVSPLDGTTPFKVPKDTITSMNFLIFKEDIFDIIKEKLTAFLEENISDLSTCEFLIPIVLNECLKEKRKKVDIVKTNAIWYGVTYKEDKEKVVESLKKLIKEKKYPEKLWEEL